MKKHSLRYCLFPLVLIPILVAIDQWTKHLALINLKGTAPLDLIPGVLSLSYTENSGMAFGMLQGGRTIFIIVTLLVLGMMTCFYFRIPEEKRMRPLSVGLVFIVGGAIGNFIDRVRMAYVIDFIYLRFINFPLFNVADCFVTWTAVILAVLLLFYYREDDLKKLGL